MIKTRIIQNKNLQQLQSKQLQQKAQSVTPFFSLEREPLNRILNLVRILPPIIVSIVMEPAFNSSFRELTQSSFGLDSSSKVISGVVGWMSSFSKDTFSSSMRYSLIVRSTTWAKGTSWQRINHMSIIFVLEVGGKPSILLMKWWSSPARWSDSHYRLYTHLNGTFPEKNRPSMEPIVNCMIYFMAWRQIDIPFIK